MRSSGWVCAAVVLGLVGLGGCRETKDVARGHAAPKETVTARTSGLTSIAHTGWTASASQTLSGYGASKAIDSDGGSRWTNGDYQTNQWFKVDFGAVKAFTEVEIWSNTTDYPRQFNVQVSNDNSTWTTVASATGTSALVQVPFAQQQARYVRIQLATSGQQYWLSIYDFNVYSTRHSTAAWAATSSGVTGSDTEAKAIDASLTTKWTSSTTQSPNGQWFQVDMRKRQTFSMVSLDGGATSNTTYPRGYKIEASDDASTWTTLATGTGAAGGVIFASFTTTQARYLKVTQTGTASVKWSLYDFVVYGQPEVPSVLSQVGWTATASKRSSEAGGAIDSVLSTGWSNETYQAVGDWYQVDMGTSRTVSGITMDSELSNDYARGFNVYVSDDPMNWGSPAGSGTGTGPFVTAAFAPKTGRYVKVQLTSVPGTSDWWGFCEFNIQTPALARAGWIVTASSTGGTDEIRNAFDDNSLYRWTSAESQATEHWVTADMITQQTFNKLTLDASPSPSSAGNYPRSYEVYVSNDGTTWGSAVATGSGTGQSISITFASQTARYIKIRQPAVAGVTNPWSIHELEVFREALTICDTVTCTASDQCHDVGTCDPGTGLCSNPVKADGTSCNDGNACTQTDSCQAGTCTGGNPVTCAASDQCHTAGACDPGTGACTDPAKADGTTCSDGNACTQTDTCVAGACIGGNAVTCTASDQCHDVGTCDPGTGVCTDPAKADGTTCSDGNACTQTDTCVAGTCTGGNGVTCAASDQCHTAGACDPGTGVCTNPAKADGTTCSDGNACTQTDTCVAGACAGGNAVTCTASDQCHTAGACDSGTGVCTNPAKADGTTCDDGNATTIADQCTNGTCAGSSGNDCPPPPACRVAGTRDPATGNCTYPFQREYTACDDGNPTTRDDACRSGTCVGAPGGCFGDFNSCDDGNPCTIYDYCYGGACRGSPVQCNTTNNECGSYCDPATGACVAGNVPDGSQCDDGSACTAVDSCTAGVCGGAGSCTGTARVANLSMSGHAEPFLPITLSSDRAQLRPGEGATLTALLKFDGARLYSIGVIEVANGSASSYVVPGFSSTLEYLSPVTNQWVPLASASYDANGVLQPQATPYELLLYNVFVYGTGVTSPPGGLAGTTIASGATASIYTESWMTLPAEALSLLADPAQASALRHVLRIDPGPGLPDGGEVPTELGVAVGESLALANVSARFFVGNQIFWSPTVSSLQPGATASVTGSVTAPALRPVTEFPSDFQYDQYLKSLALSPFYVSATGMVAGPGFGVGAWGYSNELRIPTAIPHLKNTLSGPGEVPTGYRVTYDVAISNDGAEPASDIVVKHLMERDDVLTIEASDVTAPTTLAVGATSQGAIVYQSQVGRDTSLETTYAQMTWKDGLGNVYGPMVGSPRSTWFMAPEPQGKLVLSTSTAGPLPVEQTISGSVKATGPDGIGVPGVVVQLAVTGANAQTQSATTDASGVAHFQLEGRFGGVDTLAATATIVTASVASNSRQVFWSAPYGTPCTSPNTPLDVVIAIDTSSSMEGPNLEGAKAAARKFLDTMDLSRDQLGIVSFGAFAGLNVGLTSNFIEAGAGIDSVVPGGGWINPTSIGAGLDAALDEVTSARARPTATPIIVFISDGGNSWGDPEPALARLAASGIRTFAFALGADADFATLKRIATTKNELFYVPSANELVWLYSALRGDLCRNQQPLVYAGGNQGAYGVRLPHPLTLRGEVHDEGPVALTTSEWTVVSGPGTVTFLDASSPETTALFSEPGTYVLRLTGSDGELTGTDDATITVDSEPSLVGGTLQVVLAAAGPLSIGASETLIATLTDAANQPIGDYAIQVNITGANAQTAVLTTNASGVATLTYVGATLGSDSLSATAVGPSPLTSSVSTVQWVQPAGAYPALTQGWISGPLHQSKVSGQVPITVGAGQTLTSGTITYWPMSAPDQIHTLAAGVAGDPGATLATLDTTVLANGPWVVKLEGTNSAGESRNSLVSVTVTGDYKPGRVVVEQTDMTVALAALPITIGRRYDSLEKDNVGDFGHGWSLTLGHPRLEVDPAHNVTITMPDNRRVTFYFQATSVTNSIVFAWLYGPGYVPEAGTYGSLKADGCDLMTLSGGRLVCFLEDTLEYAPTTYTFTDPFGRAFVMSAAGDLKSITDLQGNKLTFTPTGITSSTGVGVTFERDGQGRITKVTGPALDAGNGRQIDTYTYDAAGDLTKALLANNLSSFQFTYDGVHNLLKTKDPRGNFVRTSTYDAAGRLVSDTDALARVTSYTYDLAARKTTITNPDTGTVEQTFDARGLLLKEVDPLGRATEHTYDANRNELTRKNALNEVTTFTYDASGNQTSITNANGDATHVTYNQYAQPVTSTDANGHTTTITYDDRGIPTRFSDELGALATFTSSEKGLPLSVTDADGKTAYMTYDAAGNVTMRSDRLGRVTRNAYDGVGRLVQVTDPRGGVTKYGYDILGPRSRTIVPTGVFGMDTFSTTYDLALNVIEEAANGGRVTQYTYDVTSHLTKVRNADLTTREYTRDFRGNALTMKDEAGRTTTYEYDKAGQLLKTTFPDGTFTTRAYDALGRLVTATDERGNATTYEYQTGCGCGERVTKVTDPLNRSTVTTYDAMGRRTSVTDAANHTTTYAYDARGHLTTTTYADGTGETDAYDARGRRISHTDQMGAVTGYGYDDEGQLTSVTDALDHVTQYAYDDAGNLTTVTDANNHATSYEYDLLNRKTKRTLPLGMYETFAYNLFNDQTSHKDFRGKTTAMTYDTRSRLLTKVPDATLGEPTITFTYNSTGTRLKMVDGSGTTNYTYDARDRLLTKGTTAGTLTYTYDPAGNVATMRSSNTNGTSVDYAWDAANQLVSVTDNRAGGVTTSAYTATGRPSALTQPSGVGATYSYDARDRVTSLAWQQGTSPAFGSWSYGFNLRGQRTSVTEVTGRHVAYGYDAVSRLASETITNDPQGAVGNGELSYSLDPTGNRVSRTSTLAALGAQSFSYDANDQLGGDGYDLNGNTTSSDGHTYTYDFENRLKSKDGTAVTVVYDGDGNRVAKTAGGVTTKYLVDDLNPTGYLQVLEEVSGGAVQVAYTYGTMVVSQRRVGAGGAMSFYSYDGRGNVVALTDSIGAVTDSYHYDSWGNVVKEAGATGNSRLYAGEELDPDLGLISLRARQYKASRGRFLTLDPAPGRQESPASFSRYLYAEGDPENRVDPLGTTARALRANGGAEYAAMLVVATALVAIPKTVQLGTDGRYIEHTSGLIFAAANVITCQLFIAASGFGISPTGIFSYCRKAPEECEGGNGGGNGTGGGNGGGSGMGGDPRSLLHHCWDVCAASGARRAALMKYFLERLKKMCLKDLVPVFGSVRVEGMSVVECRNLCFEHFGEQ